MPGYFYPHSAALRTLIVLVSFFDLYYYIEKKNKKIKFLFMKFFVFTLYMLLKQ